MGRRHLELEQVHLALEGLVFFLQLGYLDLLLGHLARGGCPGSRDARRSTNPSLPHAIDECQRRVAEGQLHLQLRQEGVTAGTQAGAGPCVRSNGVR